MDHVALKKPASGWWSALVITHRYLGIAMSVPMLVWFLSGFVMIYVRYPHMTEIDRLRTLEPIAWQACCRLPEAADDDIRILFAQVENSAGQAVLRLRRADGVNIIVDLAQGVTMQIDFHRARAIALDAARRMIDQPAHLIDAKQIEMDQWTVGLAANAPLFRFVFDDSDRTYVYVSGATGQLVLWTTATQRFWNLLGAIPHWFYFAELRKHPALWSQILIWAGLLGTFLTALGLSLGITQIRPAAGLSPYRGWHYWHHVAGLLFGIATLMWVLSGLVSLNPWGFLREPFNEQAQTRLAGQMPKWREVRTSLDLMLRRSQNAEAVRVNSAPLDGRLYWLVTQTDGTTARLDAAGNLAALTESDLADAARRIAGSSGISEKGMLREEDSYYFRGDGALALPVYRVVLNDVDHTRFYLDPNAGTFLRSVDSNGRWYRWLFGGMHRLDFAPWIRARPVRDIVVLILLMGGLGLAFAGTYLAAARVRRDVVSLLSSSKKRDRT